MTQSGLNRARPGSASPTELTWVLPLRHPDAAEPRLAGAKAANLARLLAAGFPVPDGIILTTSAFVAHTAGAAPGPGAAVAAITLNRVSEPVAALLASALVPIGDRALAVRSSGVAEDLADASFAGQYETVLGVRGHAAVLEAIGRCWASAFGRHLTAYRAARDVAAQPMAVLIQPLVEADAAGVAFTANPVTGDRAETMVSAVRGLGDRLVSGEAAPDEWTVRDGRATCHSAPEGAIGEREALAVADLARRVETHFGAPQDIEWAMSGGTLHLLQARPITTLPEAVPPSPVLAPVDPPPGFWEREVSHFPQPLSPMYRSFLLKTENQAFRNFFQELSLLLETLEVREIGGWVYQRLVPPGGKDRRPPPSWLWWLLVRLAPPLRGRIQGCVAAMRADKPWEWVERWYGEWKPWLIQETAALREVDLALLDDDGLGCHVDAVESLFRESFRIHVLMNGAQNVLLAEFFFACRNLLGWDEARAVDLVSGLSDASSAPSKALAELAELVRNNPALGEKLQTIDEQTAARMTQLDRGFGAALDAYMQEFGCRPIRYELSDPTVAESQEWVLALLRDQLQKGYDPATDATALAYERARLAQEARATLARQSAEDGELFDRVLARAERVYPLREEHGIFDSSAPTALMRYAALLVPVWPIVGRSPGETTYSCWRWRRPVQLSATGAISASW